MLLNKLAIALYNLNLPAVFYLTVLENILSRNPAKTLPYHNNLHSILVVMEGMSLAHSQKITKAEDLNTLFLACAYHDYDYCSIQGDDSVNIQRALKAFKKDTPNLRILLPFNATRVTKTIKVTNLSSEGEWDVFQQIIRDADLLGWAWSEYQEILMAGLAEELESPVTRASTSTFLRKQQKHFRYTRTRFRDSGIFRKR